MRLVPGAVWKILFPAVFCLAIADPKNSTVTTAQENTTNFPRLSMPITTFGSTTTTDRYAITVSEPGGTVAGDDPTTNKAAPAVSSTAFEEVTKNFHQNVMNTASIENRYTINMTTSDPEGASTPNGDATSNSENAIRSLEELSISQYDVLLAENPGSTTLLSTENTINTITGETVTQSQDNYMAIAFGNVLEDPPDNMKGNPECYSVCEIIPPWATVLLCLGTAFFIFALVGLLFLLPYCTKFRRSTAAMSSSSPRNSV